MCTHLMHTMINQSIGMISLGVNDVIYSGPRAGRVGIDALYLHWYDLLNIHPQSYTVYAASSMVWSKSHTPPPQMQRCMKPPLSRKEKLQEVKVHKEGGSEWEPFCETCRLLRVRVINLFARQRQSGKHGSWNLSMCHNVMKMDVDNVILWSNYLLLCLWMVPRRRSYVLWFDSYCCRIDCFKLSWTWKLYLKAVRHQSINLVVSRRTPIIISCTHNNRAQSKLRY